MNNYISLAKEMIKKHEGLVLFPYYCTANKLTIGYGRNIEDRGITADEAAYMLDTDLLFAERDARRFAAEVWDDLSDVRKAVLIDMAFNLGYSRLSQFVNVRAALVDKNFQAARDEMLNSRWAKQVGRRAQKLASMMLENK